MWDRHRHPKGEDNNRSRRIQQLGVLAPGTNALHRTGTILFIGGRGAREEGVGNVLGGHVNPSRCFRVSYRRANRGKFPPFSFSETHRRFRTSVRARRWLLGHFMVLIHWCFHEHRRTNLMTIVRHRRRARRNSWDFPAACVSLRGAIRLPATARIVPGFFRRSFLYTYRLREGILYVGHIRCITRFFGSVTTVPSLPIFNVTRSIRLCMRRLLRFGPVLHPTWWVKVDQRVSVPRDLYRERRIVFQRRFKERDLERELLCLRGSDYRRLLGHIEIRRTTLRFLHYVVVELGSRKKGFRIVHLICVKVD